MSDFRKQIRDHYDAEPLDAGKVSEILARGREVAGREEGSNVIAFPGRRSFRKFLAVAAAVAVLAFTGIRWSTRDVGPVSYALLAPEVISFFAAKGELVPASQNKDEVKAWLVSKGAPGQLQIPKTLLPLESAVCQVLDVDGSKAYMSCYWIDSKTDRGITELVHLLVARAADFHDQPASGKPAVRQLNGWSFASWAKDDILYTLATAAPPEKLAPLIPLNERGGPALFTSTILAGDFQNQSILTSSAPRAE